jgi:hypothetical protein
MARKLLGVRDPVKAEERQAGRQARHFAVSKRP